MSREIITILREHFGEGAAGASTDGARFVFHSETAALFWAQASLSIFQFSAIARERFVAWDMFKAEQLSVHIAGKKAVSSAIRLLFAHALCAENAAAPFFNTLIPAEYAGDGQLFAKNIASMFSSLKLWRKKAEKAEAAGRGENSAFAAGDFHDLAILEQKYAAFLEAHQLFESSWEKPPFKDRGHEYYIFYPGLIADFAEYEELLDVANVHKITPAPGEDDTSKLLLYDSARAELRAAALEIRRLREAGTGYEDIALSAGNLEALEPYIKREFQIYNIPYTLRSGKPLSGYGAGALFSRLSSCAQNNFSWTSVEALLTTTALPWKTPNKNKALLSFGIRHNCVWGYRARGKKRDIWEDAFYPYIQKAGMENSGAAANIRLHHHYKKLKTAILRVTGAKNFALLLAASKRFVDQFFKDRWPPESSGIIGRCLNELSSLAVIEAQYPALASNAPLEVFCAILQEKIHVTQTARTGVNIFAYGVAASVPCAAHLIINANQNALTRLYRTLPYLRQDSRALLELEDTDVSRELIKSYQQEIDTEGCANLVRISASRNAVSGAEIPHSYFNRLDPRDPEKRFITPAAPPPSDAYLEERAWWKAQTAFPARLFPLQTRGFSAWSFYTEGAAYSFLEEPVPPSGAAAKLLDNAITMIKRKDRAAPRPDGKLRVSATSLNAFFACPVYWLYRDIIKLKKYAIRAQMLDEQSKGTLYHAILCDLFTAIKEEDKAFRAIHTEHYLDMAEEIARRQAGTFKAFRGPLAAPLIGAMAAAMTRNIARMFEQEAALYDGWDIIALEELYTSDRGAFLLTGIIDRVSASPDFSPRIVDYKTGRMPTKNECLHEADAPLRDFQIPLYLRLYETAAGAAVENACFVHAIRGEIRHIVREEGRGSISRDAYETAVNALEHFITRHVQAVSELDFTPRVPKFSASAPDFTEKKTPLKKCFICEYRAICRTTEG